MAKNDDIARLIQLAEDAHRDAHQALWDARVTVSQIERKRPKIVINLDHYRPVHSDTKDH